MKLKPVTSKKSARLRDSDAHLRGKIERGEALERATEKHVKRISDLQRVFYADERYALLIVLQGRDASGKDGTIRKVFTAVNPQGCSVTSFKAPTDNELRHDFLWRIHPHVPPRGMIGIFNRSHYEDILVPRARGLLPKSIWASRYEQINDFEAMLAANDVIILKFMLHISRDEQKQRLLSRLKDETKNWKFRAGDLDDRALWDDFTRAYEGVLAHTSTKWAPWYVVPADDNDVRNWLVASAISDRMKKLDLRYPRADPKVLKLEIE
jgi:PPK2 family polyphosphate:nucleotide phosphotransferase